VAAAPPEQQDAGPPGRCGQGDQLPLLGGRLRPRSAISCRKLPGTPAIISILPCRRLDLGVASVRAAIGDRIPDHAGNRQDVTAFRPHTTGCRAGYYERAGPLRDTARGGRVMGLVGTARGDLPPGEPRVPLRRIPELALGEGKVLTPDGQGAGRARSHRPGRGTSNAPLSTSVTPRPPQRSRRCRSSVAFLRRKNDDEPATTIRKEPGAAAGRAGPRFVITQSAKVPEAEFALLADRLTDGRDYLPGPAGQGLGGGSVVGAAVDEATRAAFEHCGSAVMGEPAVVVLVYVGSFEEPSGQPG
jgi:hypothetical protein